jgi:retron-type reverse transcriptase
MEFLEYLLAREQCVSVNGEQSSFKPVNCGVPQGSILGPLLFIMHVNGIVASLNNCKILMYADDTVIYYSHKDIEVIEKKLQDDLASITSWLQQNQLIINMKKGKQKVCYLELENG